MSKETVSCGTAIVMLAKRGVAFDSLENLSYAMDMAAFQTTAKNWKKPGEVKCHAKDPHNCRFHKTGKYAKVKGADTFNADKEKFGVDDIQSFIEEQFEAAGLDPSKVTVELDADHEAFKVSFDVGKDTDDILSAATIVENFGGDMDGNFLALGDENNKYELDDCWVIGKDGLLSTCFQTDVSKAMSQDVLGGGEGDQQLAQSLGEDTIQTEGKKEGGEGKTAFASGEIYNSEQIENFLQKAGGFKSFAANIATSNAADGEEFAKVWLKPEVSEHDAAEVAKTLNEHMTGAYAEVVKSPDSDKQAISLTFGDKPEGGQDNGGSAASAAATTSAPDFNDWQKGVVAEFAKAMGHPDGEYDFSLNADGKTLMVKPKEGESSEGVDAGSIENKLAAVGYDGLHAYYDDDSGAFGIYDSHDPDIDHSGDDDTGIGSDDIDEVLVALSPDGKGAAEATSLLTSTLGDGFAIPEGKEDEAYNLVKEIQAADEDGDIEAKKHAIKDLQEFCAQKKPDATGAGKGSPAPASPDTPKTDAAKGAEAPAEKPGDTAASLVSKTDAEVIHGWQKLADDAAAFDDAAPKWGEKIDFLKSGLSTLDALKSQMESAPPVIHAQLNKCFKTVSDEIQGFCADLSKEIDAKKTALIKDAEKEVVDTYKAQIEPNVNTWEGSGHAIADLHKGHDSVLGSTNVALAIGESSIMKLESAALDKHGAYLAAKKGVEDVITAGAKALSGPKALSDALGKMNSAKDEFLSAKKTYFDALATLKGSLAHKTALKKAADLGFTESQYETLGAILDNSGESSIEYTGKGLVKYKVSKGNDGELAIEKQEVAKPAPAAKSAPAPTSTPAAASTAATAAASSATPSYKTGDAKADAAMAFMAKNAANASPAMKKVYEKLLAKMESYHKSKSQGSAK